MNPDSELDQFLRTMGQVEPEPEPNERENPSGVEVTGKEDPV
jgi:hypothetical protein